MYNSFGDRLKRVRKTLGLTQEQFADGLGIKRGGQTISDWERGRNPPSSAAINFLSEHYSINQQWLIEGIGEMFEGTPPYRGSFYSL